MPPVIEPVEDVGNVPVVTTPGAIILKIDLVISSTAKLPLCTLVDLTQPNTPTDADCELAQSQLLGVSYAKKPVTCVQVSKPAFGVACAQRPAVEINKAAKRVIVFFMGVIFV